MNHESKLEYYKILQVQPGAHPNVIRAAYIQLSKLYHPDASKDKNAEEKMKQLNNAYDILKDTITRREYDLSILDIPDSIIDFTTNRKQGLFTDKLIINWKPPISNLPILLYELQSSNVYSDYKWIIIYYDTENYTIIDKIVTYARHTFRIRAINKIGAGAWAIFKEEDKFIW